MYTTKSTRIKPGLYGCRVYRDGVLIVEGRCASRSMIGPTLRDLMRTLDKLGGDSHTAAARRRKYRAGNACASVVHLWGRNDDR